MKAGLVCCSSVLNDDAGASRPSVALADSYIIEWSDGDAPFQFLRGSPASGALLWLVYQKGLGRRALRLYGNDEKVAV